uniref:Uncharacterized protein n=1 Tax=Anguilla anguilla TaxID=7936 RepID=A0A0E9UZ12_ANGAN
MNSAKVFMGTPRG